MGGREGREGKGKKENPASQRTKTVSWYTTDVLQKTGRDELRQKWLGDSSEGKSLSLCKPGDVSSDSQYLHKERIQVFRCSSVKLVLGGQRWVGSLGIAVQSVPSQLPASPEPAPSQPFQNFKL